MHLRAKTLKKVRVKSVHLRSASRSDGHSPTVKSKKIKKYTIQVFVSRFTIFAEDFVIRCCQVTILFRSQNRSLLAFSEVSMDTVLPFLCLQF